MASFYLVIVPQGVTPTWSRANIATNSGWTATTIAYHDADTDPGTVVAPSSHTAHRS